MRDPRDLNGPVPSLSTLLFRDALHLLTDSTFDAAPIAAARVRLDGIPASVDASPTRSTTRRS